MTVKSTPEHLRRALEEMVKESEQRSFFGRWSCIYCGGRFDRHEEGCPVPAARAALALGFDQ